MYGLYVCIYCACCSIYLTGATGVTCLGSIGMMKIQAATMDVTTSPRCGTPLETETTCVTCLGSIGMANTTATPPLSPAPL